MYYYISRCENNPVTHAQTTSSSETFKNLFFKAILIINGTEKRIFKQNTNFKTGIQV